MSDILEQVSSQDKKNPRVSMWASFIIGIANLIFFGFALSAVLRLGYFDWINSILVSLTGIIAITSFICIVLVKKGQYVLGTSLIFIANLLPSLAASILLRDISLITIAYLLFSALFLIVFVLPEKSKRWASIASFAVILISILADILNPAFQNPTEGLENFAPIIIGAMTIGFIATLVYQVHGSTIRVKLLFVVFGVLSVVVFFQTGVNLRVAREQSEEAERLKLLSLYEDYSENVDTLTNTSAMLSISFADREDIRELLIARNRTALLELLTPVYTSLKTQYNIRHLYVEKPDGTVFVRVHNPKKYGDNITYRLTAAAALETQETVSGVEVGPSRIGIRSVSPLWENGNFIGMVEVGLDYDQEFVDTFKARHHADYNLWITYDAAQIPGLTPATDAPAPPTDQVFFYAGTNPISLPIEDNVYNEVLNSKKEVIQFVTVNGEELGVIIAPMIGYGDKAIGIVEILTPRTETLATITRSRRIVLVPAIVLTLIGLILMWVIINQVVLRPVGLLTAVAKKQIAGELSARVENLPPDEFGYLGNTFNTLSEQLETTYKTQEATIAERTKNLEERSAYLESSARVSQAVASITDTDELTAQIVKLIKERFNLYYVGLFLADEKNEWAILQAGTGEAGKTMLKNKHRLKIGEGMIGWSIANAEARIALDVGDDAVHFKNPDLPETRSEGALPLRSRGRVLGALTIQSAEGRAFNQDIINTLQIMADQVAVALDNAELFAKSKAALKAEREAYGELSQEDWQALLQRQHIPSYLSDAPNSVYPVRYQQPPKTIQALQDEEVLQDNGLTAVIPIKIRGHLLGGVKLRKDKEDGAWTKEQLELAKTLAEQISISLESARLFDQSQRRVARERVIGDASARMRETLSIESVLQAAAEELHKALGGMETKVWLDAKQTENEKEKNDG